MSDCEVVEVEVVEVLTRREAGAQQALADMMAHPHAVEILAAEIDAQRADVARCAAHARRNAVRSEAAGDRAGAEAWADRAELHESAARQLAEYRQQVIERFGRRRPPFDGGC